jgi:hypothetical protein
MLPNALVIVLNAREFLFKESFSKNPLKLYKPFS